MRPGWRESEQGLNCPGALAEPGGSTWCCFSLPNSSNPACCLLGDVDLLSFSQKKKSGITPRDLILKVLLLHAQPLLQPLRNYHLRTSNLLQNKTSPSSTAKLGKLGHKRCTFHPKTKTCHSTNPLNDKSWSETTISVTKGLIFHAQVSLQVLGFSPQHTPGCSAELSCSTSDKRGFIVVKFQVLFILEWCDFSLKPELIPTSAQCRSCRNELGLTTGFTELCSVFNLS